MGLESAALRRRDREAEGAPLLREYAGKTCIEGSNPSGSAKTLGNTGLRAPFSMAAPHPANKNRANTGAETAQGRGSVGQSVTTGCFLACDRGRSFRRA